MSLMEPIKLSKQYIVAVSGGVDSITLLDLLIKGTNRNASNYIIIAHINHGIRSDSALDESLVKSIAQDNGLRYHSKRLKLSPDSSEALARQKRYEFLDNLKSKYQAEAIMTAHHQDDLIETFLLNLARGTNRRGLSSLNSSMIYRPLLGYAKQEIIQYAVKNNLTWRDDSTNQDLKYRRNYIRHKIVPKLDNSAQLKILSIIKNQEVLNNKIDNILSHLVAGFEGNKIPRLWFNTLELNIQREIVAYILRFNNFSGYSDKMLTKTTLLLKVLRTGAIINVSKGIYFKVEKTNLALIVPER